MKIAIVSTAPEEVEDSEDVYGALQKVVEDTGGMNDEVYTGAIPNLCLLFVRSITRISTRVIVL